MVCSVWVETSIIQTTPEIILAFFLNPGVWQDTERADGSQGLEDSNTGGYPCGSPGAGRWEKAGAPLAPGIRRLPGDGNGTRQGQDMDLQAGLVGRVHSQAGSGCGELQTCCGTAEAGADGPGAERGS